MSKTRQPPKRPGLRVERSGDYEVGYGKPPVSTRFKAGQSGNPKGRPRGSKGFNALMRRALSETIPVREDGQLRQMSRREVIIKSLIARALKGDARAIERLLPFMQQLYPDIANQMELRVHIVRLLSGTVRRKLALPLLTEQAEGGARHYRIVVADGGED